MENSDKLKIVFSKNLKLQLDKRGLNQTDMARDLNIPETTVSNWMKASTYPRPDKIQLMANYFNIRRSDLTEEQPTNLIEVQPNFVKIPILGTIACGEPILAQQNVEGYMYEFSELLPTGNIFALVAKGDSMEPTIPNGSKVLIREQSEVEYGEIAAVLVNGDTEATLKRVKKQGETILLMPDNPKHEPYIVNENNPAKIIGKAVSFKVTL
ncbi:LexA family protein [Lysinibacillus pakistanensis]|uniref:XRE family transcriptional regulator n=1 Tax=Lysinibacillus pakistanensis TaxID=759811 RepID=A0AAX3WSG4_9BACI|nr:XRE family transcriptional regulator [Lysinibacillus pakistanensis]MDM5230179.1 XRE family transcriptional regulator [Lysinibacillus pakistanensis]WHY45773.1 XRE family transcriptional regulator [Lysinibacillus pakistanensis]WHY50783.1 XRE family transcriptional regulator [Lysinibacillus pakistanensis]